MHVGMFDSVRLEHVSNSRWPEDIMASRSIPEMQLRPAKRDLTTSHSHTCHATATGRARFDSIPQPHLSRYCYRLSAI